MTRYFFLIIGVLTITFFACSPEQSYSEDVAQLLPAEVDFNFHIRPILSDRCFACHGPDEAAREANLRLDDVAFAYQQSDNGRKAIHPRRVKKSEVWHRIYSDNPEEIIMPPPESNLSLSDYEKALISKWISQGAKYAPHWAFVPPKKVNLPKIRNKSAVQNPIDHFVLAKLEQEKRTLSPEADKEQLLRRVTFDLTGLTPSISEIDAFLADQSPAAYEKVLDRLLLLMLMRNEWRWNGWIYLVMPILMGCTPMVGAQCIPGEIG